MYVHVTLIGCRCMHPYVKISIESQLSLASIKSDYLVRKKIFDYLIQA
jgi:hypothetical protein